MDQPVRKNDDRLSTTPHLAKAVALVLGIALAVLGAGYLLLIGGAAVLGDFSIASFEALIRSWGMWGVAGSIALMVIHTFVPFPAELVAFANGMVYGPYWGTVITWVGAMLGAFVAFGLARALGRPFVERILRRRDWRQADELMARHGTAAVFLGRFVPVISFNLINWAAGLTNMSWWTFTWVTGLGILPMTTLMVVLGDRLDTLDWWVWLLLLAAAVAGCLMMRAGYRRLAAGGAGPIR
jgi:uncharacterized membrane protein YdjX (TVP38/TMEM64 family)